VVFFAVSADIDARPERDHRGALRCGLLNRQTALGSSRPCMRRLSFRDRLAIGSDVIVALIAHPAHLEIPAILANLESGERSRCSRAGFVEADIRVRRRTRSSRALDATGGQKRSLRIAP